MRALVFAAVASLATIAVGEPPTPKQIEAAFADAQEARKELIAELVKRGVARRLTISDRANLKTYREMKVVRPRIQYKLGSVGVSPGMKYDHALSPTESLVVVNGRYALLENFDNSKMTPGEKMEDFGLYLDRFDEKFPIYRPIDLLPYVEKFGKVAP